MLTESAGSGLDQGQNACFGRSVVGLLSAADESADGGNADDGAARGRLDGELMGAGLDGVESAGEVGGEGLRPEGGGNSIGDCV